MKKTNWKKIILLYFHTIAIIFVLFLPIDIVIYGNVVIENFTRYLFINILYDSLLIVLYTFAVIYFNSKLWGNKIVLRMILETLFAFITIYFISFLFYNLFGNKYTLIQFILYVFNEQYCASFCLQGGFIILMIETIYLYNKRKENDREKEKFKYIQLKNQLNPHFLFNSLSVSISLIKKDQNKAVEYMKKLSSVYRYVLINTESDFVSLEEEIDFIKKYIDILQIRYDVGLNVTYNIEDKVLNMQIVPMSLQLLVENAVKHNATYSYNPLNIHIYSEGKQIMVANNIIKKTTIIDSIGVGLKNLNQKYNILCSTNIHIINDSKNFIVKIPLK